MLKKIVFALMGMMFLMGCGEHNSILLPKGSTQDILFEVEVSNFAWGNVHYGYMILSDGNVYKYNYFPDQSGNYVNHSLPDIVSEEEMFERINTNRTLIKVLDINEVQWKSQLIPDAAEGELSEPEGRMADAGIVKFKCFLYDAGSEQYTAVLLRLDGDNFQVNHSTGAAEIVEWLYASIDDIPEFYILDK